MWSCGAENGARRGENAVFCTGQRVSPEEPGRPPGSPRLAAPEEICPTLASCLKLLDALEELDDVRSVTSNLEADEALMEAALN